MLIALPLCAVLATQDASATVAPQAPPGAGPWLTRHKPHDQELELGFYAGVFAPHSSIALRDPTAMYRGYDKTAANFGVRVAYFPVRYVGFEGEAGVMPTRFGREGALLYTGRGHLVAQLPLWSVVPFVVVGGGALAVASDKRGGAGHDTDMAMHAGGGLKLNLTRTLQLRWDMRAVLSDKLGRSNTPAASLESMVGVAWRFDVRRKEATPAPPPDSDGDSVPDDRDACPQRAGDDGQGCPQVCETPPKT